MEPILDKIGQEIIVGSFIVYGHLLSRSAGLRIGKVLKIEVKEVNPYWRDRNTFAYNIHVWGIDQEWNHKPPSLNIKKGILSYPDRIVVLYNLPKVMRDLLEGIDINTKLIYCTNCSSKGYFPSQNFRSCEVCAGKGLVKP